MKKLTFAGLAFAAFAGLAPAVNAAPVLQISGATGAFLSVDVCGAIASGATCTFDQSVTFTTPAGFFLTSADVTNTPVDANFINTNIDFEFVTLNGVAFDKVLNDTTEVLNIFNQALVQGATNTLRFRGVGGSEASFSGNMSFAVPGPIAGAGLPALMALGGFVWARRRKAAATA